MKSNKNNTDSQMTTTPETIINVTRGPVVSGGYDKVKRYNWKPLGPTGEFVMIAKDELHIDHSYQRDKIREDRINEIASNWDWVLCGALSISERDGQWFVIDGQHRKIAADKRSDVKLLPCMVFPLDSRQKEAGAFVCLNSQKSSVAGIDRFKAMIVAGDRSAIGLQELLNSTGHRASAKSSSKGVSCILCLWKLFKRNEKQLRHIWPLLADMCSASAIVDALVRGIWGCEIKANEQEFSLTQPPFRATLIQAGGMVLTAEIRREISIVGHGGERIEVAAVLKWINRQRLGAKYKLSM